MRNVIREAIEQPGFSFVDITSQCIENNGRRIGFASANDMLTFYRKTYKRAAKDAEQLESVRDRHALPADRWRRRDQRQRRRHDGGRPSDRPSCPRSLPDR